MDDNSDALKLQDIVKYFMDVGNRIAGTFRHGLQHVPSLTDCQNTPVGWQVCRKHFKKPSHPRVTPKVSLLCFKYNRGELEPYTKVNQSTQTKFNVKWTQENPSAHCSHLTEAYSPPGLLKCSLPLVKKSPAYGLGKSGNALNCSNFPAKSIIQTESSRKRLEIWERSKFSFFSYTDGLWK